MVAAFDDQEKNVKLSLRQTEILAKLQSIVSDIASDRGETCVFFLLSLSRPRSVGYMPFIRTQTLCADVPPRVWPVHARVDPWIAVYGRDPRPAVRGEQHALPVSARFAFSVASLVTRNVKGRPSLRCEPE